MSNYKEHIKMAVIALMIGGILSMHYFTLHDNEIPSCFLSHAFLRSPRPG